MLRKTDAPVVLVLVCACLMVAPGCGGDGPPLVTVTGTVTRDGKPLEGVAVMFSPDPGNPYPWSAEDTTDAEGNYNLRTRDRYGAAPGKYHVVITPKPPDSAMAKANPAFAHDPFMAQYSTGSGQAAGRKGKAATATATATAAAPTVYAEDREITTEGSQVLDFDVTSKEAEPAKG